MVAKKAVLTKEEAFSLLDDAHNYFNGSGSHINGRHQTEITAEAMAKQGLSSLARDTMMVHETLKDFQQGRFSAADYLDGTSLQELYHKARSTPFAGFAVDLGETLTAFAKLSIKDAAIDWDKSSQVLAEVKRGKFPGDLTMVEKLDQWKKGQPKANARG